MSIWKERTLLWWVLLILGLIGTVLLVDQRMDCQAGAGTSAALSQADLTLLAQASGMSEQAWLDKVSPAGLGYILQDGRAWTLEGKPVYFLSDETGALPEGVIYDPDPAGFLFWDTQNDCRIYPVVIEDHTRTAMYLPAGLNAEDLDAAVKALWLFPDYADRAVGNDTREIENLLFRAATDRGLRLLILSPFTNEAGEVLSDPELYASCLSSLGERLDCRGIRLEDTADMVWSLEGRQDYKMVLAAMLPAMVGVWLVLLVPPIRRLSEKARRRLEYALIGLAVLAALVLALLLPSLGEKLLPLASAVLLPCVGMTAIWRWAKGEPKTFARLPLWVSALAALGLILGGSLVCGLSVAALMTTTRFLMGAAVFSGVKFALGLPLALCFCLLAALLWRDLVRSGKKLWLWLTLLALAGAALLLVVRSGDLPGGISGVETALRNFLEAAFYGRPRTKELLFAAPCVPVFVWACRKKLPPLQLLCGMGVGLEWVSVVNTFCHGVASVSFSAIRSLQGGLAGWCLGMLAVGVLALIFRKKPSGPKSPEGE